MTSLKTTYNTIKNATLPSGMIMPYAGSSAPSLWLLCDGTSYSTTTYPSLYSAIGNTYGGSGGSFNVPNFKGNIACCYNGSDGNFSTLGRTGGQESVTLSADQLPSHNHSLQDPGHSHGTQSYSHGHNIYSQTQQQIVQNDQGHVQCTTTQQVQGSGNPGNAVAQFQTGTSGSQLQGSYTYVQFDQGQFQGGGSHTNLQPYNTTDFIIKT